MPNDEFHWPSLACRELYDRTGEARKGPPKGGHVMKSGDERTANLVQTAQLPDLEQLASNTAKLVEEMGKATAAALKPVEEGRSTSAGSEEVGDLVKTLGQVVEHWAMDPQRVVLAQTSLTKGFLDLWT